MPRKDEVTAKRAEYMTGTISHEEYYLWLAGFIGFTARSLQIPLAEVRAAKDPHFSDISLSRWDNHLDTVVRLGAGIPLTLSDAVCIAKAVARKAVAR